MSAFRIGPFELVGQLGRGGMGSVWTGRHVEQGVPVAVKVLYARYARDPWFRSSFAAEIRAVARLDHPNIVQILDHGEVTEPDAAAVPAEHEEIGPGSAWLAMERLPGDPLSQYRGRVTWEQFRPWLYDLMAGLSHAHARGLLHRDLKPKNVMVHEARAVLVDFGLAREWAGRVDDRQDGVVVGTRAYMAPEQFDADEAAYGPWTDLYALGCLVWAMVCGAAPFGHNRPYAELVHAHMHWVPPAFAPRRWMPPGLQAWLRRLLEKNPLHRFQCVADARHALDAATSPARAPSFSAMPMPVVPPPIPERFPPEVGGRAPTPSLLGAGVRLFGLRQPPLIGRVATQELLWDALRTVHAGEARVVLLQGPSGTGKSRIATWLGEAAHGVGAATVIAVRHGEASGRGDGLWPAVRRALGLQRADASARRRLADRMVQWDLPEAVNDELRATLLPGGAERRRAVGARRTALLLELLTHLGRERPVVLTLDDVHWGPDSLAFVARLLAQPPGMRPRVLVVATLRPVADGTTTARLLQRILAGRGSERVPVEPLPPGWRSALVQSFIPIADSLARDVEMRAGGNPLFTLQLIGDWVERGILVPDAAGLVLRPGCSPDVPSGLHELWQRRLERALVGRSDAEQQTVELAAVLGTYLHRREWLQACRYAGLPESPEVVDALMAAGLAQPDALGLEHGWGFVHGMLRESLLRTAVESGRSARWHRACAEMLAHTTGGSPDVSLRLGHHLLAVGEHAAAIEPLGVGALAAFRSSEYLRAERGLDDRTAALDALGAAPMDPRRARGLLIRARLARRRGDWRRASDATAALLSLVLEPTVHRGPDAGIWTELAREAHREAGRLALLERRSQAAVDHARTALSLARQCGDSVALAWCRRDYGLLRVRSGARLAEVDGILAGAQSTFERVGETFGAADCMRARALLRHRELRFGDGEPLRKAARRALRQSLREQEPAHARVGLGDVAWMAGRHAEAARWYAAARERFEHIGHPGPTRLVVREVSVLLERGDGVGARAVWGAARSDHRVLDVLTQLWLQLVEDRRCSGSSIPDFAGDDADPEVAEQAERVFGVAVSKEAPDVAARAAQWAIQCWSWLGWPARARRIRRRALRR